jgi:hypothetical protein
MTILNLKVSKRWYKEMSMVKEFCLKKCIAQYYNTFSFTYNALALTRGGGANTVPNEHKLTKGK